MKLIFAVLDLSLTMDLITLYKAEDFFYILDIMNKALKKQHINA